MIKVEKLREKTIIRGIWQWVQLFMELGKVRITIMVTFTTAMGYVVAKENFDFLMIYPLVGTFLMASGSAAFNHYQDMAMDRSMRRTQNRPLPSGKVTPLVALRTALSWIFLGSFILIWGGGPISFAFALMALIWYNGIYAYFKRQTSLAVIPGSLVGALPPLIGWASVSPYVYNEKILVLALYMFLWQIPHFWLILMLHYEDYEKAVWKKLPSKETLKAWILWSMVITIGSLFSLGFFQIWESIPAWILYYLSLPMVIGLTYLYKKDKISHGLFFGLINLYTLFLIVLTILDHGF